MLRDAPTAPDKMARNEQMVKALELRIKGTPFRAIADQLDCSTSTAHALITDALAQQLGEIKVKTSDLIDLECERCDALQLALAEKALQGDPRAVQATLSVMERRAKLLGLDAAQKIQHSGSSGVMILPPLDNGDDKPIG